MSFHRCLTLLCTVPWSIVLRAPYQSAERILWFNVRLLNQIGLLNVPFEGNVRLTGRISVFRYGGLQRPFTALRKRFRDMIGLNRIHTSRSPLGRISWYSATRRISPSIVSLQPPKAPVVTNGSYSEAQLGTPATVTPLMKLRSHNAFLMDSPFIFHDDPSKGIQVSP